MFSPESAVIATIAVIGTILAFINIFKEFTKPYVGKKPDEIEKMMENPTTANPNPLFLGCLMMLYTLFALVYHFVVQPLSIIIILSYRIGSPYPGWLALAITLANFLYGALVIRRMPFKGPNTKFPIAPDTPHQRLLHLFWNLPILYFWYIFFTIVTTR